MKNTKKYFQLSGDLNVRIVKPGSNGNFYFRFTNYGGQAKFKVYFTNPDNILTSRSPKSLGTVIKVAFGFFFFN